MKVSIRKVRFLRHKHSWLSVAGTSKRFLIDKKFSAKLAKFRWVWFPQQSRARAVITAGKPREFLHRYICKLAHRNYGEVFFSNRDVFDCRLENLAPYRRTEEGALRGLFRNNQSGQKGVIYRPRLKKWVAMLRHKGKLQNLGVFSSAKQAGEAYWQAFKLAHPNLKV